MSVFYYLFAPFLLIVLALWPICYGAFIGVRLARRRDILLLLHVLLVILIILCITPVSVVDKQAGADYGTFWPLPMGISWLVRGGGAQSLSADALRLYWQLAWMLGGISLTAASLGYGAERLRSRLTKRSGRS